VGSRRGARDGEDPQQPPRFLLRGVAGGVLLRLPDGRRRLPRPAQRLGPELALALRLQHHPRIDQPDHPQPGARVGGLGGGAAAAGVGSGAGQADPDQPGHRPALRLPGPADDRLQLDEPRHPGRLPDLPQGDDGARDRLVGQHRAGHRHPLQHRRDHRRHGRGLAVRAVRPSAHHRAVRGARAADRPALRLLHQRRDALPRLVPDAAHGPGRLGRHPGPPDRAQPGRDPRVLPRRDLSAGQLPRGLQPADPAGPGQEPRLPVRPDRDDRAGPGGGRPLHRPRVRGSRRRVRQRPHLDRRHDPSRPSYGGGHGRAPRSTQVVSPSGRKNTRRG
jgi:hypothetical protein